MRFGILTGGGDVPGLNPCIQTVVHRAVDAGHEIVGIRRGWGGLIRSNADDPQTVKENLLPLDRQVVRSIDRTGGTFLHTSRTNPGKVKPKDTPDFLEAQRSSDEPHDFTAHVLRVLEKVGLDVLITIGGDRTVSYSLRLPREGVPVVAIPKTMDNDVFGTDYCIGFSTAVTRSVEAITAFRTSAGSHERIGGGEVYGRNSGETSLFAAYLADVDRAVISEVPLDIDRLVGFLKEDRAANPSNYAIMTISEGARPVGGDIVESGEVDAYGHKKLGGIGHSVAQEIKRRSGVNTMFEQLAYIMRSGAPASLDRMVAISYGYLALDQVAMGHTGRMVALQQGIYTTVPLDLVLASKKRVDVTALYDDQSYRPKVRDML